MKIEILSCAEDELAEIVDYYNRQLPGLGFEFAAQVKVAFNRIASFPDAWPQFSKRSRRCMIDRFPYGVFYQARDECLLVLGIMHLKRDPVRWQEMEKRT